MKTEVYNGNTGTILTNGVVPWGASVIKKESLSLYASQNS